jgi:hypothetical protein
VQQCAPISTSIEHSLFSQVATPLLAGDSHDQQGLDGTTTPCMGDTTLSHFVSMSLDGPYPNTTFTMPSGDHEVQDRLASSSAGSTTHSRYSTPSISGQFIPPETLPSRWEDGIINSAQHKDNPHHRPQQSNSSMLYLTFASHLSSNGHIGVHGASTPQPEYNKWPTANGNGMSSLIIHRWRCR